MHTSFLRNIFLFIFSGALLLIPQSARSTTNLIQRLTANSGYSIVAPYDSAVIGTANFGGVAGNTSREYLTVGHIYRIRQHGSIQQVKLYTANLTNLTAVYIKIWRKEGTTYDLVGMSNNILSSLITGQINTVVLNTPITNVQEGDYYGYRLEWSSGVQNLYSRTGISNVITYQIVNTTPATTGYAWESQTANTGYTIPIELYMTPPIFVAIGDSMIAGNSEHSSYMDNQYLVSAPYKQIARHVADYFNYTYQNMAKGAENIDVRAARFNADVVTLKPKFVIIAGGTADFFNGITTKSIFLSSWASMLDASIVNNITPVVLLIFPCTRFTNAQHQTREDWNSALVNLILTKYPTVIIVDTEINVGQKRTGGDDGNLWDLKTGYAVSTESPNFLHFNATGKRYVAQAIIDAVKTWKITP